MLKFLLIYSILWFLAIFFIPIRLTMFHPVLTVRYAIKDIYHFFKYHKWNLYKAGKFVCYDAGAGQVFGSGKTLSVVHILRKIFKKKHNKLVFDFRRMKWVTQKIHILTNLTLTSLPYEKLVNLGQIIQVAERCRREDDENDTLTCILVCIDETQNQLHCRSFKDNISPEMLKSLTECRHYNMSIYYDSPRFHQVDALLRQCTSVNVKCKKIWRWQTQKAYDAADIENASNPQLVKHLYKSGFFCDDKLFAEYDTKEIIDNLVKAKKAGDYLTDEEILTLQCNQPSDLDAVENKSVKFKRNLRKVVNK